MTIRDFLKKHTGIEIELLLAHVLGKSREFLYMEGAHELTRKQANELTRMVKRRMAGEPVAYVLGCKDFFGYRFLVNKNVLVPRPESEWLVEKVLSAQYTVGSRDQLRVTKHVTSSVIPKPNSVIPDLIGNLKYKKQDSPLRENDKATRILDLGTGSGCIAISVAKGLGFRAKGVEVVASDISPKALTVAKQNDRIHCAKVKFIHSDLFSKIEGKFDIIVANLPYVPKKIYNLQFKDLKFEPISALTDGTHSFQIYRRFFEQVGGHIHGQSIILLEIDPSARKFIQEYKKKYLPSGKLKFHKDFNNFWRYAEIKI